MRFVVYGAGAVGGVVGARLHQGGHEVVLIARGAHFEAIQDRGLRLDTPAGSETLALPVVDHPPGAGVDDADVVLLAMKTQDTAGALDDLAACASPGVAVVCMQNGVENERLALRRFERVYGVVVMCPTGHLEPGVVQAFSTPTTGLLDIGRYPSGADETAGEVAEAFESSTFVSEVRPDVMRWKHRKLIMNLGNAAEALCGPDARFGELGRRATEEGEAVLRAAGIDVATTEEDAERRGDILRIRPVGESLAAGDGRWRGGSSWQSLVRGTGTIESDYLNGEIVLLARHHGIDAPVNTLLQRLAGKAARESRSAGSIPEAEVLALLGR